MGKRIKDLSLATSVTGTDYFVVDNNTKSSAEKLPINLIPINTSQIMGVIGENLIADGSITTSKIAEGAIVNSKIANGAIKSSNIENFAVGYNQIAGRTIDKHKIKVGGIESENIRNGNITTTLITDNAITTSKIAAGAVDATKIAKGNITTNLIADGAIVNSKIANGTINSSKIENFAVGPNQIADGAIDNSKIANGAINSSKIENFAVGPNQIAGGSIDKYKITAGAVITSKIADGSITTSKIAEGAITTSKIATGNITTTLITDGAITADKIASGVIYTQTQSDYKYANALRKTATDVEVLTINDATVSPVTKLVIAGFSSQESNQFNPFPTPTDSGYRLIHNETDVYFEFNEISYNIPLKLLSLGRGSVATEGNTKDEYDVITGIGLRKIEETVWNGTEGWVAHSTPTVTTLDGTIGYIYRYSSPNFGNVSGSGNVGERFALCTYLRQGFGSFSSSNNIFPVNSVYGFAGGAVVFVILDSNFPTVQHWTDFLASKSSTDKPCRVLYKKSTPTTITSTPINISTVLGVNDMILFGGTDITITYNRDINAAITELANAIAALQTKT